MKMIDPISTNKDRCCPYGRRISLVGFPALRAWLRSLSPYGIEFLLVKQVVYNNFTTNFLAS